MPAVWRHLSSWGGGGGINPVCPIQSHLSRLYYMSDSGRVHRVRQQNNPARYKWLSHSQCRHHRAPLVLPTGPTRDSRELNPGRGVVPALTHSSPWSPGGVRWSRRWDQQLPPSPGSWSLKVRGAGWATCRGDSHSCPSPALSDAGVSLVAAMHVLRFTGLFYLLLPSAS